MACISSNICFDEDVHQIISQYQDYVKIAQKRSKPNKSQAIAAIIKEWKQGKEFLIKAELTIAK